MAENSSFVSKPARGWLHPDSVLASEGVTYAVRVRKHTINLKSMTFYYNLNLDLSSPNKKVVSKFDIITVYNITLTLLFSN